MKRHRSSHAKSHALIRANGKLCIYCLELLNDGNFSLEHMPPRGMFRKSHRLKGLEFATCKGCNEGTKAADAAVAFFARIDYLNNNTASWKFEESLKFLKSADDGAPGFINEIFGEHRHRNSFRKSIGGLLLPAVEFTAGPISHSLLNVFAAKVGMAMYNEYVGSPLPNSGGVHIQWYLNDGLDDVTLAAMLNMLPNIGTLKAGAQSLSGQFDYRYNSDDKSIVASLTHFHGNFHIFTIAVSDPATYGFPIQMPNSAFIRPGELLNRMPKPRPIFMKPLQHHERFPGLILPQWR